MHPTEAVSEGVAAGRLRFWRREFSRSFSRLELRAARAEQAEPMDLFEERMLQLSRKVEDWKSSQIESSQGPVDLPERGRSSTPGRLFDTPSTSPNAAPLEDTPSKRILARPGSWLGPTTHTGRGCSPNGARTDAGNLVAVGAPRSFGIPSGAAFSAAGSGMYNAVRSFPLLPQQSAAAIRIPHHTHTPTGSPAKHNLVSPLSPFSWSCAVAITSSAIEARSAERHGIAQWHFGGKVSPDPPLRETPNRDRAFKSERHSLSPTRGRSASAISSAGAVADGLLLNDWQLASRRPVASGSPSRRRDTPPHQQQQQLQQQQQQQQQQQPP
ncbi:unnamed protein product [Polarella glacialis]|uniref:Uncharacterized protein n=1 Tax=Polarella glacialis TaxID=89957 RepID=A0A813FC91_POLGL|nr:unnamed protein product [Polarella glacialis]